MRLRREAQFQKVQRKEDECTWNTIIVWTVCASITVLIFLYLAFGPHLYHAAPVLIGSETVSTLTEEKRAIPVYESTVTIDGVGDVFYRYSEPRGLGRHVQPDVLLLHGAKYASQTWKGLGTLQILGYYGYRTYAVDLPGYKLSKKATPPNYGNDGFIDFMTQLIDKLRLSKVVIIAPSMSGKFALPVLLQAAEQCDLRGFIAISPETTNRYSRQQYQAVEVPVLMLYGERDKTESKEETLYWMGNIPDTRSVMIAKAEHAAFVGNPEDFHMEILRFLSSHCRVGEDTDTDNELDTLYDDSELFGYGAAGDDYDTGDTDAMEQVNHEEFLRDFFQDEDGYNGDYYDDTELYFDNDVYKQDTNVEGELDTMETESDTDTIDTFGDTDDEQPEQEQ
eukprot:CAMPEP_0202689420 /NCGR_PEP_ID=MMETSP1385-20130828/4686_1 /ASSEMBLY_ACC=CAM_ASM_000861 /TAXON_ID=933848 /ORGANISM="Elphidium margaritaceum" /LENGTH=393 /DNA_ID=CAMNT_0049344551 /DNA_START=36 /DNA_END=1217 /DNA_ORIENTATION=+